MKNTFLYLPFACLLLFASACVVTDDEQPITPNPEPEPEPEPTSLRTGLLFHAPFTGNADDIGLNGLAGTVTGATLTSDRNGVANEAYRFDGVDDVINYGEAAFLGLGGSNPYTMTAWVKLEDRGDQVRQTIITKFNGGVAAGWYLSVNGNREVQAYRNVAPWSTSGEPVVPYDEYVHVASTFDGTDLKVYLNGEVSGSVRFGNHPNDRTTDVLIGGTHSQNNVVATVRGTIDDVRIYNRVLTNEELTWLANN